MSRHIGGTTLGGGTTGGSSGYWGNAPPTPLVGDGSYLNPATGYRNGAYGGLTGSYDSGSGEDADPLGSCVSYGQFLGRSTTLGYENLRQLPSWQAGSSERRFESQMVQMLPYVGQLYSGYTVATGWDPIAGECLTTQERVLAGIGLGVDALGQGVDVAINAARSPKVKATPKVTELYEVGDYKTLYDGAHGLGMEAHHIPQYNLMSGNAAGYTHSNGLAVALPRMQHRRLPKTSRLRGSYAGTKPEDLRKLVSQQLRDLANAEVSKETLRKIGKEMRKRYPELYVPAPGKKRNR